MLFIDQIHQTHLESEMTLQWTSPVITSSILHTIYFALTQWTFLFLNYFTYARIGKKYMSVFYEQLKQQTISDSSTTWHKKKISHMEYVIITLLHSFMYNRIPWIWVLIFQKSWYFSSRKYSQVWKCLHWQLWYLLAPYLLFHQLLLQWSLLIHSPGPSASPGETEETQETTVRGPDDPELASEVITKWNSPLISCSAQI